MIFDVPMMILLVKAYKRNAYDEPSTNPNRKKNDEQDFRDFLNLLKELD